MTSPGNTSKKLLTAAWIAPMDGPLLRDGGIVCQNGRILAIGTVKQLRNEYPDATTGDLGNSVILPGLINAHTHLELSGCTPGDAPESFTDWIGSIPGRIGPNRDFTAAALAGARQSIGFGVTTVGDISQQCHLTRSALRDGPLRVVSFGEVLGIGATAWKVGELLARATDQSGASDFLTIALSPHAMYSLDRTSYQRIVHAGQTMGLRLATHLAELPYEREFLEHHTGPFREFMERIGIWQDTIETFDGGPIEFAKSLGLLDQATLLAHVNYCNNDELPLLAAGHASIVYCPRTHAYFGHPPHRWREMLALSINVAIGTDSCASSPDLNLVDDLRLLHRIAPEIEPRVLWEMATIRGAKALGMESMVGSLSVGKFADFAVFPVENDNPLSEILERHDVVLSDGVIAGVERPSGEER